MRTCGPITLAAASTLTEGSARCNKRSPRSNASLALLIPSLSPDLLGLNKEMDQGETLNLQTWPVSKRGCNWTHTSHISELVLFCWISSWNLTGQYWQTLFTNTPRSHRLQMRNIFGFDAHTNDGEGLPTAGCIASITISQERINSNVVTIINSYSISK
jgi:hypothetical protein